MEPEKKYALPVVERFNDRNIKVFALGGLGEIGKNMYVIECNDEIIIIDSGILFPDNNYGVDYIIPDYTYLQENQDKIVGLFITHGHEDHIGGIPYLLAKVKIPAVYSCGIATQLIKMKMAEHNNIPIKLIEFKSDSVYKFKNFEVSFFRTIHSIPDSMGIAVKTRLGYILHTGDFKLDFTPLGEPTEFAKLTHYADAGVLCLLSDSTNALVTQFSKSEKKIGSSINSIFSSITGRIIISTFASNVHRVSQIIQASVAHHRKVIVFGRSMVKIVAAAQELDYLGVPKDAFADEKDIHALLPQNVTILLTGSQGEPLAALTRIAAGTHRTVRIMPGDTVVFSSSVIPGNQAEINNTINNLYKKGASVIVNSPLSDTHTTGHASEIEEEAMLALTRPQHFMPIHGEETMLHKHAHLALSMGMPKENVHILHNGDVLTFADAKTFVNSCVKSGNIYIDDLSATVIDEAVVYERRILSEEGAVVITFLKDKKNALLSDPVVISRGFVYMKKSTEIIDAVRARAKACYENYRAQNERFYVAGFRHALIDDISSYLYNETKRRPMIIASVLIADAA